LDKEERSGKDGVQGKGRGKKVKERKWVEI